MEHVWVTGVRFTTSQFPKVSFPEGVGRRWQAVGDIPAGPGLGRQLLFHGPLCGHSSRQRPGGLSDRVQAGLPQCATVRLSRDHPQQGLAHWAVGDGLHATRVLAFSWRANVAVALNIPRMEKSGGEDQACAELVSPHHLFPNGRKGICSSLTHSCSLCPVAQYQFHHWITHRGVGCAAASCLCWGPGGRTSDTARAPCSDSVAAPGTRCGGLSWPFSYLVLFFSL